MLTVLLGTLLLGFCESKTLGERVKILEASLNARLNVLETQFKDENDALKLQIDEMQDRFVAENEILRSQVQDLESQVIKLQDQLASETKNLKSHVEELDMRVHAVTMPGKGFQATKIEILSDEDKPTQKDAVNSTKVAEELPKEQLNTDRQQTKENMETKLSESKWRHPSKRIVPVASTTKVAFSAHMSTNQCLHTGQTLIYDATDINVGHGYTSTDGIFDAPVSGVYVFTWTTTTAYRNYVVTELIVNGVRKGTAIADSYHLDANQQSSVVVVVQVNAGDHVFIRQVRNGGACSVMSTNDAISRFSGWLLYNTQ